jgi:transposase InsO family protein
MAGRKRRIIARFTPACCRSRSSTNASSPYTPKHNGKVERYQQTMAHELLYARSWNSEAERRHAIGRWLIHYNYIAPTPPPAAHHRPHASRPASPTS